MKLEVICDIMSVSIISTEESTMKKSEMKKRIVAWIAIGAMVLSLVGSIIAGVIVGGM